MTGDGSPRAVALARWIAGSAPGSEPADPPCAWTLEACRPATRTLAALAASLGKALAGAPACLGARVARAAERPVPLVAAAVVALPVLRLLLPGTWGTAAALAVVAATGLSLVLAAASVLHSGDERRLALGALVAGFALRLLFAAALRATGGFPDEYGYYDPLARDTASCWAAGGPSLLSTHPVVEHRAAYFYLLSGAYLLAGPGMIVGRVMGSVLGVLAALLGGEVARPLAGPRAAALAVAVLALLPEQAFWSASLSRDTLAVVLVLAAFALLLRRGILLALLPLGLLALNSFLVAGALAAALVAVMLARAVTGPGAPVLRAAGIGTALIGGAAALVLVGSDFGHFFTPELIAKVRTHAIGTEADFLPGLELHSAWGVLALLPAGAAFVLGAPSPWEAVHLHRFLYGLAALAGLAVSVTGLAGAVASARRPAAPAAPLLVFAGALLALFSVLEATSGIVVRHRLPLTAVLAIFAAVLLSGLREPTAR